MTDEALIARLRSEMAAGRVVTIVGTGISVAASKNPDVNGFKVATWVGLLKHGLAHLEAIGEANETTAKLLRMQVDSGETDLVILAAEAISQRMKARSPGTFLGWLKDTIGQLSVRDRAVIDALAALPGVLATVNYDNLLEEATGKRAVTWLKTDDVQDLLTGVATDAILHLHGWFKEPDSVVLGLSSYLAAKDHPHARAVLNLMTIDRTLLFVGCGDTVLDPNFSRLIEWGRGALRDVAPRHYLLCRTAEIGAFQKKLVGAPWIRILGYGKDHSELAAFLVRVAPGGICGITRPATRLSLDLDAYREAMRKRYARLKLEELDPIAHDVRPGTTVTGMFIDQSARECVEYMPHLLELPKELLRRLREQGEEFHAGYRDEETAAEQRRAYLAQPPRRILEILGDPQLRRAVVLGDPGSGKSMLLQYLLLSWADLAAADIVAKPLPVLIELREYARLRHEGKVAGFLDYLHDGASVRWHFDKQKLQAWLKDNPSCFLFDGLDEVFDPVLRKEVGTAIHRLGDEYPRASIIVTSRIVGYQHQMWRDEGFRHFMLQELDDEEMGEFLARWHSAAYEDPSNGEAKRVRMADAIERSRAIRQIAGNPLLLTMMAILNRTQDLPRDRAELYEQCARLLLHQWKVDLAFTSDPELAKASLDYKDKRGLLLCVARAMQTTERGLAGNLIDEAALEEVLSVGLESIPNLRPGRAARALVEQLRGRNFMLCSAGGRAYAFVHRTFLEYFCALEILERFQTDRSLSLEQLKTQIFGRWMDETWHEVLTLLAGMLAPQFVREVLGWLQSVPDPHETCQHLLLSARCVGEVRDRAMLGDVEEQVFQRVKALVQFDLPFFDELAGDDGSGVVSRIRARAVEAVATTWPARAGDWLKSLALSARDPVVRTHAMEALARGWKGDPGTETLLKAIAQEHASEYTRAAAAGALAAGWPATLPWLREQAERVVGRSEEEIVQWAAVAAVARAGWKDPETVDWLEELARSGEGWGVRGAAVQALAHQRRNPTWLKALALADPLAEVREIAVEALVREWREHPDTLPTIRDLSRDLDASVRSAAVLALARGWKGDPEVLLLLKALLDALPPEEVRTTILIVQLVAGYWRASLETVAWLKSIVQSDRDDSVRKIAVKTVARYSPDSETLLWLKEVSQLDRSEEVRRAAVAAVARCWKSECETLTWLKLLGQSDRSVALRSTAVEELGRGWSEDPEVARWLRGLEQSDRNAVVRESAVKAVACGWRDSETLRWLKDVASRERDGGASRIAVMAVARYWRVEPDTLPWLKSLAQSNRDAVVRSTAATAVARGWKSDAKTLPWLKELARSDRHVVVRGVVAEELTRGWGQDLQIPV